MFNLDVITKENHAGHYLKQSYIPDHQCRMLKIGVSGSGKTSALVNLI